MNTVKIRITEKKIAERRTIAVTMVADRMTTDEKIAEKRTEGGGIDE